MLFYEVLFIILILVLGIITTISDFKLGIVPNTILSKFTIIAIVMDVIYYGFFARDYIYDFLLNFLIISIVSLFLFYSHSLAGGDCKLIMVFALLYPSTCLVAYNGNQVTLFGTIGIAVFLGYIYILLESIYSLFKRKKKINFKYVKKYILNFFASFFSTLIYLSALNMVLFWINVKYIGINAWIVRIACLVFACIVSKYTLLKKWFVLVPIIVIDIILCLYLGMLPISLNVEHYILIFALLICQLLIRTGLYEEIEISILEKNMILSTTSSIMMQGTRIKNIPHVSCEDLRDRLTEDEVAAVKRWGKSRKISRIVIVKKIPFALFVFMGFIMYLGVWGVLK